MRYPKSKYIVLDKEELERLYEQFPTTEELGEELGMSSMTTLNLLKRHGVKVRSLPEATKLKFERGRDNMNRPYSKELAQKRSIAIKEAFRKKREEQKNVQQGDNDRESNDGTGGEGE